jgi:hypothetical protein
MANDQSIKAGLSPADEEETAAMATIQPKDAAANDSDADAVQAIRGAIADKDGGNPNDC